MSLKPFLPALVWLVAVTVLSVSSNVPMPKVVLFSPDKLAHAGAYAVLVWLLAWGISKSKGRAATLGELLLIFVSATAYGALMEWVQGTFFPNRFFEYDDMLANAAGALLATMLYRPLSKILRPTSRV